MPAKQIKNYKWLRKAGNFLFFGLLLLLLFNSSAKAWLLQQFMAVGLFQAEMKTEAPVSLLPASENAFSFREESGAIRSTADLKGKVVFIHFWATWCPPCLAEMPSLNALYNQFREDENLVFLFINEDEDSAKAKAFLQRKGYAMPLVTRAGNLPATIFSGTLPTTIVLNKEGRVVFRHEGLAMYNSAAFIHQLKALL